MYSRAVLAVFAGLGCATLAATAACSSASSRSRFESEATPTEPDAEAAPAATGALGTDQPAPAAPPPEVNEVFSHSGTTLYRLDPKTNVIAEVAKFDGCSSIRDIALDEASNMYAVSSTGLFTVDKATAKCTSLGTGKYPTSLSFVPKGTIDPSREVLVGYDDSDYVSIDTTDGSKTVIGGLGGGLRSSGDIVSVTGGKTYLTTKGGSCTAADCLVEVDPTTGKMTHNWGSIDYKNVFGLSFWGGKLYGFNEEGELFEVTFGTSKVNTKLIAMANKPADLSFWGAGSSTSAPLVAPVQ